MSKRNLIIGKLVNDLEYIIIPNENIESVCLSIAIRVGSNDEDPRVNGVSHVLEHMLYKGNKRFTSKLELYSALDNIGAKYNAYTDKNITNFYVKSHHTKLRDLIDIFSSLICEPYIDATDLENEKKVIIEEMNTSKNEVMDVLYNRFFKLLYDKQPISQKIIGTKQTIKDMTRDDLVEHMNKYYVADNMVIAISGKVDKDYLDYLNNSSFIKVPHGKSEHKVRELIQIKKVTSVNIIHKPIEQMILGVSFPTDGLYDKNRFSIRILDLILNGSMSSRLFIRLREKEGLVYSIGSILANFEEGGIYFFIMAFDSSDEKYKKILNSLFDEIKLLKTHQVTQEELNKWKNYIRSNLAMELEDTQAICDYYCRQMLFFRDNMTDINSLLNNFDAITLEDINRTIDAILEWKKMKIVLIGNYNSNAKTIVNNIMEVIESNFQTQD